MILTQLMWRFARHGDDEEFYRLQASDAIRWIASSGVPLGAQTEVLDLGCGHGIFGGRLEKSGCPVTFADADNFLRPEYRQHTFLKVDLDRDPLDSLGRYDLVVCSNVLEHLSAPGRFLKDAHCLLKPDGLFYLSWTNWLSPWGGHEFSPLHYLGPRLGPRLYDALARRPRFHKPYVNLFPTYIGSILGTLRDQTAFRVIRMAPRYYTEVEWIMRVPLVREFLAWNCSLLLGQRRQND
ncbi:MAG: class I SAM-dependent methyltransferase [Verrucomicrobiae bacterium]|nr:class I SAM-dependent methyltransferase [Verrucomicrobiae bacterium]